MARRPQPLITMAALAILLTLCVQTRGQDTQNQEKPASKAKPSTPIPSRSTPNGAEFEKVRKALEALNPDQLRRFQQNFIRWSNLSPEEKKLLGDREAFRRQKIQEEGEAAYTQTGLQLPTETRELFIKRYAEERRKLEEELRRDQEERRRPRLSAIVEQLKSEFSTPPPAAQSSEAR